MMPRSRQQPAMPAQPGGLFYSSVEFLVMSVELKGRSTIHLLNTQH
jgi:hypothetical protein